MFHGSLLEILKWYTVSPAIETFGTHRLIFGSSPVLPLSKLGRAMEQVVPSSEWYTVLRKCFADLGEDGDAMSGLMGGNAAGVYELQ